MSFLYIYICSFLLYGFFSLLGFLTLFLGLFTLNLLSLSFVFYFAINVRDCKVIEIYIYLNYIVDFRLHRFVLFVFVGVRLLDQIILSRT